jgi:hypothetical protein
MALPLGEIHARGVDRRRVRILIPCRRRYAGDDGRRHSAYERNREQGPGHERAGYCYSLGMKRAASFVACAVILAACVNDFDALFDGTTSASDGGIPSSSSSGSSGTSGASGDDGDGGAAPPPFDAGSTGDGATSVDPTQTCGTKQPTCNDQRKPGPGFSIENSCFGCGCACAPFDCDSAEGVCDTTCSGGATCTGSCRFQDECTFTVKASVANFVCRGDFTDCKMTCTQGSICNFDCSDARRCTVVCDVGSSCIVKLCKGDNCTASPCPNQKTCADGSIVCGEIPCK